MLHQRYATSAGIAAFAAVVISTVTPGAARHDAVLNNRAERIEWEGALVRDAVPIGEVPECAAVPCVRFDLKIDLPFGSWSSPTDGGVQIALRWPAYGNNHITQFGNNLLLYVYRDGTLVTKGDGIIATAQSVLIPEAANGDYAIYVAFDPTSPTDAIEFDLLAEVEYEPRTQPIRALLPDLSARPQRNVTFETPVFDFFEPAPAPGETCFDTEKAEAGAQTCLRFDQVLANIGEGPLEMRFALPKADPAAEHGAISQRVFRSDGGFTDRSAGQWEFHPSHQHYHFEAFALSRLWPADPHGARVGSQPLRSSRKVSFCIVDIEIDAWGEKGDGPRTYQAPVCLGPSESDAEFDYLVQGMTRGWADVYDWYLPDQYIEVTGVPDGLYILETVVDADDFILESNETNNCGSVYVRLTGVDTPQRRAELLGTGPAC